MSRRKPLAVRKPCGRISSSGKTELISPAEVRRLVTAAANGMRSAEWSSSLGRLLLVNKIEPAQYSAGRHWAILVSEYSRACQSPAQPRSIEMDRTGGTPADVGSVVGEKEAKRHEKASKDYVQGRDVLRQLGPTV